MAQQYIGTGRISGTTQTISVSAASAQATNAFGAQTRQVRLCGNTAFHAKVGSGSFSATTSDPFFPANSPETITVTAGQKIAAIRASTNGLVTATDGTVTVTELE